MSDPTIMILAGGTGGHVYPALAVATALRQRNHVTSYGLARTEASKRASYPQQVLRWNGFR